MPKTHRTLIAIAAAATFAMPAVATAADAAPKGGSCEAIAAKTAPKLDTAEQARLAAACATRDEEIGEARADRKDARTTQHTAVKSARTTYRAAVKSVKGKPAAERKAVRERAAAARKSATTKAHKTFATAKKASRKDVREARTGFRKVLKGLLAA